MAMKLNGAGYARRVLSVIAGGAAIVLVAAVTPADASVTITEFGTPIDNSSPGGITVGPDGNIWFTEVQGGGDGLGSVTPDRSSPPAFGNDDYAGTSSRLGNVTTGPDGNLWFTIMGSPDIEIGAMTRTGTMIGTWNTGDLSNGVPPDIVTGPGSALWFTANADSWIGRITTSGVITQFAAGDCGSRGLPVQPGAITVGPDGNLWYTIDAPAHCPELGRMTPSGSVTMFTIPAQATDVAAGPDGNIWFTTASGVGDINPTTGEPGVYNRHAPGTSIAPSPCTNDLWFTAGSGSVGKITTSGAESVYSLPTAGSDPDDITADNGTVWLTEPNGGGGQIARVVDTSALLACVTLLPSASFAFPSLTGHQGIKVGWMVQAPGTHGVADASGMNLFGISPSGGPIPVPIGSFVTFRFDWAGVFPYDDPYDPAAKGRVKIPVKVAPVAGTPDEASVTWASGDAPSGSGFDVQLKPPGSHDWITWQSGVSSLSARFGPNDPLWAGAGKYSFRARLRQLTSNAASGYSAAKSITLS
jgi:virginiamycin B lyase